MGKYFRTIYLYIVSFVTLCMIIAGFVGTVNSIVAYNYPVTYYYNYYEDSKINETEIRNEEKVAKRNNLKATFTYAAVLVCGVPLYAFHWKQANKESKKEV